MVDRIPTGHSEFAPGTREATFEKNAYDVFTSATIQLEPADVGRSLHISKIQRGSTVTEILLGLVSVTSWFGVAGGVLALLSQGLSAVSIEIDPTLAEGSFVCPGETCVITAGLSVLTAMEWIVATVGFAIGFLGQLGVHVVRSRRVRAWSEVIETERRDSETDRYLVTGLGQATFKIGQKGILITGDERTFVINWDAVDVQRLYFPMGQSHDPLFPHVHVEERPEDLRSFAKERIYTEPFRKLHTALTEWGVINRVPRAFIDLPVKNPRAGDARIREWLRLPSRAFTDERSNLGWIGLLAVIWLCAENEFDPDHVGYPEKTES
ncbi:hypothetical protein [Oceanicaulis sp.]|uniref:hypothetical protein n=1 Tax=Oceanicaulis sp. TaxID=1924941 RepID=UPI003F703993